VNEREGKEAMKKLIAIIGVYLCASVATLFAAATTQPASLTITKGGTYTGAYATIAIAANDGKPVVIDRCALSGPGDLITCDVPCNLTVTNCTASTKSPGKFAVVWRFTALDVEHNLLNGTGGILVCDDSHTAKSANVSFNRGNNITGATGPATRQYTSFIQFQNVHCYPLAIDWNHLENVQGKSATTDAISLMLSGGLADTQRADVANNFVHGVFNWPVGPGFNGSGIMAFDPGATAANSVTVGGFTNVHDNQVVACENQAYVMAGGHHINVQNNRAINDGTETHFLTVPMQAFDWGSVGPATPASVFGQSSIFQDNEIFWTTGSGKPQIKSSIASPVASTNNVTLTTGSDAAEVRTWAAKCAAAKVCVGPLPVSAE
jgi:hypothetical protein